MRKLLLFDIDGTLLDTGGAGLRALRAAFLDTFAGNGRAGESPAFPDLDLGGSTDSGILRSLFARFDIEPTPENEAAFYDAYHPRLEAELTGPGAADGRLMPGIPALLSHLQETTGHVLGLLTGNTCQGARTKIANFELTGFFDLDVGAFGDDHHDRDRLGPLAMRRAEIHAGRRFDPADTFIIGDTAKDIRCARACGARAVAVATGHADSDQLRKNRPDYFFEDFRDIGAVDAMLRGDGV